MNIRLTSRDLATLRIGKRGPAFVDLAIVSQGVRLTSSNGHTVSLFATGGIDAPEVADVLPADAPDATMDGGPQDAGTADGG